MVDQKKILILGGSYAGVSTAHYLLKHVVPNLPEEESHQVVLVSTASCTICRPACPRAMISDDMFDQGKLFVSIPKVFEQYPNSSFSFTGGTATKLDHNGRTVTIENKDGTVQDIKFYALIIATGASTPSPLLGLNTDEGALRSSWKEFRQALTSAKHIVIGGGGPAGVETAGELGEHLNGSPGWFRARNENPRVAITVVTSGSQILPALRTTLAQRAEEYLSSVGVKVIKNTRVTNIQPTDAGSKSVSTSTTIHLDDGRSLDADLYIPAFGTSPNTKFIAKDLLTPDGRVETNASTLRVDKAGPRIYAVGDVASYARPAIHLILEAIPVVCANIKLDLLSASGLDSTGTGQDRKYKEDTRETQLVPIGKSKGVGAAMGYQLPSFMVWLIKGRDYWLWTTGNLWSGKQWAKAT